MKTFIYTLIDPRDDQNVRYVGVTRHPKARLRQHLNDKQPCHRTNWIKSLRGVGVKPEMVIIEEIDESNWQERERFWIKHYRDAGCQITNGTDGGDGMPNPTPETRTRLRAANIGKRHSPETLAKMSAINSGEGNPFYGKHHSATTRAKISAAKKGKRMSAKARANMSVARSGKPHSAEHSANISAALKGKPKSAEHIAKNRTAHTGKQTGEKNPFYGRHHSPETRAKISAANTGRQRSEESRAKQSESNKRAFAKKRNAQLQASSQLTIPF